MALFLEYINQCPLIKVKLIQFSVEMLFNFFFTWKTLSLTDPVSWFLFREHLIWFLITTLFSSLHCWCHWLTKAALQIGFQKLPWKIVNKPFPGNKNISNSIKTFSNLKRTYAMGGCYFLKPVNFQHKLIYKPLVYRFKIIYMADLNTVVSVVKSIILIRYTFPIRVQGSLPQDFMNSLLYEKIWWV